jgi:nucleolar GTP-binding protein
MNFQDLQSVNNHMFYLDQAFKKSKKHGEIVFPRTSGDQANRIRRTEVEKVKMFSKTLIDYMEHIVDNFPNIDNLPEIYNELVRLTIDYDALKLSLGSISWAGKQIASLTGKYIKALKVCETKGQIDRTMKEYYGRTSSVMKQINGKLLYIENARKIMKNYPTLKTDLYTVCITGFPNIGKSTLLSKITPAKPEIKNYAFTTKSLNQGYATFGLRKIQFIDTPGVLDRAKMNNIELQAHLVLKYLANLIVYVIDLTETYPIKIQEQLLKTTLKDFDKPIIVYLSKSDLIDPAVIAKAKKKYKAVNTLEALQKKIEKSMKDFYFE